MASSSKSFSSIANDLHVSSCLLALITKRPEGLDRLVVREDGGDDENNSHHAKELTSNEAESSTMSDVHVEDYGEPGIENHEENLEEDFEETSASKDTGGGAGSEVYLAALKSKVLDRLAETLARYKSDPTGQRGPPLDSKHVSSAMMITYGESTKVKLLCAKNEGLDQQGKTDDTEFLESWKKYMESIAKAGPAAEEAKASLFTLVINYQRRRIIYYLKKLQEAFVIDRPKPLLQTNDVKLSEAWVQNQSKAKERIWVDDHGTEYRIPIGSSTAFNTESEAARSGDSLKDINVEVSTILDTAQRLCGSVDTKNGTGRFTSSQESDLKKLMTTILVSWRSIRHRSALKTRLRRLFHNLKQRNKLQNTVIMALNFLSRIYLSVETFIDAAVRMPMFQSIEYVPVTAPLLQLQLQLSQETPIEVIERLGILITNDGWTNFFQKRDTLATFQKMIKQKRFMHAELQALYHYDTSYGIKSKDYHVHPYIGCIRGTHETIMHQWNLPAKFPTVTSQAKFRSATEILFNMAVNIVQGLFQKRYPLSHLELRAQSSAALSTAQTVYEREMSQMQKSQQNFRRMMTMPIVMNDAVMITEIVGKPGYAYVIGGTAKKSQEMTLRDAEIYQSNHTRLKLGLEKQHELPPKRNSTARICRRCREPSGLYCSACRMSYCSKSCQRKDWRRHVFVCAVKDRPNDFDHLWIFVSRRSCMTREDAASSQLVVDLFSDDHLCRTFGFVHCLSFDDLQNLLCLYSHFLRMFKSAIGPLMRDEGSLGKFMEVWATLVNHEADKHSFGNCFCIQWFLQQRTTGFEIPDWDCQYTYQGIGLRKAEHNFSIPPADDDPEALSPGEGALMSLYSQLFRPFNNVPDVYSAEWANFGFCYCTNWDQRKRLANAYLELAQSGVSLDEIAQAWPRASLLKLMESKGIKVSYLKAHGIIPQRPNKDDFSIYRLIAEVSHTVSGRFCFCFRPKKHCWNHLENETHLSRESDADYGFHGTNPWERWQLLVFYNHVFRHPSFNAQKMQEAKRDQDVKALEQYLDSLVPNYSMKIGNMYLADAMFPKIRGRLEFPNGRPHCFCILHSTVISEGLDWKVRYGLPGDLGTAKQDGEEEISEQSPS